MHVNASGFHKPIFIPKKYHPSFSVERLSQLFPPTALTKLAYMPCMFTCSWSSVLLHFRRKTTRKHVSCIVCMRPLKVFLRSTIPVEFAKETRGSSYAYFVYEFSSSHLRRPRFSGEAVFGQKGLYAYFAYGPFCTWAMQYTLHKASKGSSVVPGFPGRKRYCVLRSQCKCIAWTPPYRIAASSVFRGSCNMV